MPDAPFPAGSSGRGSSLLEHLAAPSQSLAVMIGAVDVEEALLLVEVVDRATDAVAETAIARTCWFRGRSGDGSEELDRDPLLLIG